MATNRHHLNPRGALVLALLVLATLSAPSTASAYGWPVKPFDRQHPVRGFFGDPRIGGGHGRSFHFGVDVSAPDGTPVYATLTGTALLDPQTPESVYIRSTSDPDVVFSYWHVVPTVRDRQPVVAYRTVIGHIARGWEHVHFAELRRGVRVNPLRRGAMGPYRDRTRPTVHQFGIEYDRAGVGRHSMHGADLVVQVSDKTPLPVAGPWFGRPVMPALVRWRLRGPGGLVHGWRTAADFRLAIPANGLFGTVYAHRTMQNRPERNGRYVILLARNWSSAGQRPGIYTVEVAATDTRGNTGRRSFPLAIR